MGVALRGGQPRHRLIILSTRLRTVLARSPGDQGRRETAGAREHSPHLLARHVDCAEPVEQLCRIGERVTQDMKLNGLLAFSI